MLLTFMAIALVADGGRRPEVGMRPDAGTRADAGAESDAGLADASPDAGAPRTCTLTGTVELLRGGATVPAEGRVAVYVERVPEAETRRLPKFHKILQKDRQFSPQVLVVEKGDTVNFFNNDKEQHSVFSHNKDNPLEFKTSTDTVTGHWTFSKPRPGGERSTRIQCNIHKKMRAEVLVVENPYFTIAQGNGVFRIEGIPAGVPYTLKAWEMNGAHTQAVVKDCRGEKRISIKPLTEGEDPVLLKKDYSPYIWLVR